MVEVIPGAPGLAIFETWGFCCRQGTTIRRFQICTPPARYSDAYYGNPQVSKTARPGAPGQNLSNFASIVITFMVKGSHWTAGGPFG